MVTWLSCSQVKHVYPTVPDYFGDINYPEDNLPTASRLTLGKQLFFEKALSIDSTLSCNSCHLHEYALADNLPISLGVDDRLGKRNTPSLYNAGYLDLINKDGGVSHIDLQAMVPIEDENEMGISILKVADRLNANLNYVDLSYQAYNRAPDAYAVTRALATYVRSLVSSDSPYDRYLNGDKTALTTDQEAGRVLFYSDRLKCGSCHSGFNLTDNSFQNNGLYKEYSDLGRALITQDKKDIGKFRVPSLRNASLTAPYMHDGSLDDMEAVIDHYASGGSCHINQSADVIGFEITLEERSQLISFLEGLTGATASEPL